VRAQAEPGHEDEECRDFCLFGFRVSDFGFFTMTPSALRTNIGTWLVPDHVLPFLSRYMTTSLPPESFDQDFHGQWLRTTYFEDSGFRLLKARKEGEQYLTLRIREYPAGHALSDATQPEPAFYLSAKTESRKFRVEISSAEVAQHYLHDGLAQGDLEMLLPPDLLARAYGLTDTAARLVPVVGVTCRRYAVENEMDRLTLDVSIASDRGKALAQSVLEHKQTEETTSSPHPEALGLRPVKLSKFLWSLKL
jgi:hypothetical protein